MRDERALEQALGTLWQEVAEGHFLHKPTTAEALVALERRREIVSRLLTLKDAQPILSASPAPLMMDHFHMLLQAESAWLEHALRSVQLGTDGQGER